MKEEERSYLRHNLLLLRFQLERVSSVLWLMQYRVKDTSAFADDQLQVLSERLVADTNALFSQVVGKMFKLWLAKAEQEKILEGLQQVTRSYIEEYLE